MTCTVFVMVMHLEQPDETMKIEQSLGGYKWQHYPSSSYTTDHLIYSSRYTLDITLSTNQHLSQLIRLISQQLTTN